MFLLVLALYAGQWVETTQQDFSDGWFTRDIYACHLGDGALEFVGRYDLNNDGYIDIMGCGWIMWGSSTGFSDSDVTMCSGGGGCDAADLDGDGYADFITTLMGGPIIIHWGTASGPGNSSDIDCNNYNNEGVFIADFNKDGYLDILASTDDNNAGIFWGSSSGYSASDVTRLPCNLAGYNPEAADLNKDGWLDVVVITGDTYGVDEQFIYWGSTNGFSSSNRTKVLYGKGGPHGMSIADLNRDGWLDLVYSANIPDYGAILWGSADKYRAGQTVQVDLELDLPDRAFGGSSVADLDDDSYLDIVFFGNDGVPPRIFWGGPDAIRNDRYTDLEESFGVGSGGIVNDFSGDGHLDIVVLSYNRTVLFYGPSFNTYTEYGMDSHHGFSREIGNVYTREQTESYYSSIYDTQLDVEWIKISWDDYRPAGTDISMEVRCGEDPDTSSWSCPWTPLGQDELHNMPAFFSNHRYLQYKVNFTYTNPAYFPMLYYVKIDYEGNEIEDEGVAENPRIDLAPLSISYDATVWEISFGIAYAGPVSLAIFGIDGRKMHEITYSHLESGNHILVVDGSTMSPGVYFITLNHDNQSQKVKFSYLR